jgi:hypothetical protein
MRYGLTDFTLSPTDEGEMLLEAEPLRAVDELRAGLAPLMVE